MRTRALVVLLVSLVATLVLVVEAPSSSASRRVTLERPRTTAQKVVFRGRARPHARVRLVRRTSVGWVRVAVDRADERGRYRAATVRPRRKAWTVRAATTGTRSTARKVRPVAAPTEEPTEQPPVEVPPAEPKPTDACGVQPRKADGSRWQCTFVDEFDGDTLDPTKWIAQDTSFSGMTNGRSCYVNSPATISVGDGKIRLSARKLATSYTCRSPFGAFSTQWASAAVTTKGRFSQAFGRFAFRAKMPATTVQGAHSALWLFPDSSVYGKWPYSGEIDVAEWYSALPKKAFPSLHYFADDGDDLKNVFSGRQGDIQNASTEYHTYAVEWTPTIIRFFYDDELVFAHSWKAAAPLVGAQPFDQPFNTVLTQAWGGLWNAPTAATPDTVTMSVDWVRIWK